MIILTLKTDQEQAHLGLFDNEARLAVRDWPAGRKLAESLHQTIDELLKLADKKLADLEGIVGYKGPGSFTGLRIGLTAANTLAFALKIPVVGTSGEDWENQGIRSLLAAHSEHQIMPEYGAPVHITLPKK